MSESGAELPLPQDALEDMARASAGDNSGASLLSEFADEALTFANAGLATDSLLVGSLCEKFDALLPMQESANMQTDPHWIVLGRGSKTACVAIDRPLGIEQIVVMELDDTFPELKIIGGAALTGAGKVALVLDAKNLITNSAAVRPAPHHARESEMALAT